MASDTWTSSSYQHRHNETGVRVGGAKPPLVDVGGGSGRCATEVFVDGDQPSDGWPASRGRPTEETGTY